MRVVLAIALAAMVTFCFCVVVTGCPKKTDSEGAVITTQPGKVGGPPKGPGPKPAPVEEKKAVGPVPPAGETKPGAEPVAPAGDKKAGAEAGAPGAAKAAAPGAKNEGKEKGHEAKEAPKEEKKEH